MGKNPHPNSLIARLMREKGISHIEGNDGQERIWLDKKLSELCIARYNAFEKGGAVERLVKLLKTKDMKNLFEIDVARAELESLLGERKK